MTGRIEAIRELLEATEAAHAIYERDELNGVYDAAWARWYAAYAVEHGADALGADLDAERLAALLESAYADFASVEPPTGESWSSFVARRIAGELA